MINVSLIQGAIGMEEILEKLHTFFDVDKLIAFISGYLKKPVILESTECQLLAYNS